MTKTRYFYDTEFLEDGETIDLISIGIVSDDGREYYAVNGHAAWDRIQDHPWLMDNVVPHLPPVTEWKTKSLIAQEVLEFLRAGDKPELWAWYSAYDHVVLCQLFGRMNDLPSGVPMYTHDLRSFIDYIDVPAGLPKQAHGTHDALGDARYLKRRFDHIARYRDILV